MFIITKINVEPPKPNRSRNKTRNLNRTAGAVRPGSVSSCASSSCSLCVSVWPRRVMADCIGVSVSLRRRRTASRRKEERSFVRSPLGRGRQTGARWVSRPASYDCNDVINYALAPRILTLVHLTAHSVCGTSTTVLFSRSGTDLAQFPVNSGVPELDVDWIRLNWTGFGQDSRGTLWIGSGRVR